MPGKNNINWKYNSMVTFQKGKANKKMRCFIESTLITIPTQLIKQIHVCLL